MEESGSDIRPPRRRRELGHSTGWKTMRAVGVGEQAKGTFINVCG